MTASQSTKKQRKPNAWNQHLKKIRQEHPDLSLKQANDLAKKTYKKGETNVKHNSHSSVDLSRHDGRINSNTKTGISGSSERHDSLSTEGAQAFSKNSSSGKDYGSETGISFEDNKVEVENPSVNPAPGAVEIIPPTSEEQTTCSPQSMHQGLFDPKTLEPALDMLTRTAGSYFAKKFKDPELKVTWAMNKDELKNLSQSIAMTIDHYAPSVSEDSPLMALLLTLGVIFVPRTLATMDAVTEQAEKEEKTEETQTQQYQEPPIQGLVSQEEIAKSWNARGRG